MEDDIAKIQARAYEGTDKQHSIVLYFMNQPADKPSYQNRAGRPYCAAFPSHPQTVRICQAIGKAGTEHDSNVMRFFL